KVHEKIVPNDLAFRKTEGETRCPNPSANLLVSVEAAVSAASIWISYAARGSLQHGLSPVAECSIEKADPTLVRLDIPRCVEQQKNARCSSNLPSVFSPPLRREQSPCSSSRFFRPLASPFFIRRWFSTRRNICSST